MKKTLVFTLFLSFILMCLAGCKKDNKEITCNLNAPVNQAAVGMNVVYSATQTGDGTIATLSYVSSAGTITVQNPTLPWTVTVYLPANTDITFSAAGTVTNGSLNIEYTGTGGGYTISGKDACSHQAD
jgi:hypothetical protein